jgi:hypothetical protein
MRVKTLTLTTASAAALTIGLASPALALGTTAGAVHKTGFGAQHQGALHDGLHHMVALPKGDDDDDDDGDGGGGGDAEIGGFHRTHHGPRGLCGVGGRIGGLANGCGEENGDDDDDEGGPGGGGDFASEHSTACCQGGGGVAHVRVSRPAAPVVVHRYMPSGPVRTGFGGSQGMNLPLGVAGLSLLAGGAGLVPLARRRLRASARS